MNIIRYLNNWGSLLKLFTNQYHFKWVLELNIIAFAVAFNLKQSNQMLGDIILTTFPTASSSVIKFEKHKLKHVNDEVW